MTELEEEREQKRLAGERADALRHRDEALRAVMARPEGRAVLWSIINEAGLLMPSIGSDALVTAFNEGKRSVAIALLARVKTVAPADYVHLLTERLVPREPIPAPRTDEPP